MQTKKIDAAIKFLESVPTQIYSPNETDKKYEKEVEILNKVKTMTNPGVTFRSDSRLLELTKKAESQDTEVARKASYELGRMYLGLSRPGGLEMPVSPEIAAGFFARAIRLGDKKSKEHYADIAESLGWFNSAALNLPKMEYEYEIRKAFNLHRAKMAEEFGGKLPELDEFGLIPEPKNEKASEIRSVLMSCQDKMKDNRKTIKARVETIENMITDKVFEIPSMLKNKEEEIFNAKDKARKIRWRIAFAIILMMIPGLILGPGEGIKAVLYFLFMIPCTIRAFIYKDINSFEEYMNAIPTFGERLSYFGAMAVIIVIACVVLNIVIGILGIFSVDDEFDYARYKENLYCDHKIKDVVKEAERLVNGTGALSNADVIRLKGMGVKHNSRMVDEIATMYHAYLFCQRPFAEYQGLSNTSEKWKYTYTVPNWIYKAHEGLGDSMQADSVRFGDAFTLKYWGREDGVTVSEYFVDGEGNFLSDREDYYADYEKSVGIECLLAGYCKEKETRLYFYPWSAKDCYRWFVCSEADNTNIRYEFFEEYFANVADSAYLDAYLKGDKKAAFLLAQAIYPSERGFKIAEAAMNMGAEGAEELYGRYDYYFNPPVVEHKSDDYSYDYDYSYSSSSSSSSSEPDPDPWGFKAWAAEIEQKKIDRNNEILDNEYRYGDLDADSYMKLKEKYGSWD